MNKMNIMRRIYLDAQKNCGLQVGDWVKVIEKAKKELGYE